MSLTPINPESLGAPSGYSNGMLGPVGGRLLFVAGQIGWRDQRLVGEGFIEQFEQALFNIKEVVEAAGGQVSDVANLTVFVVKKSDYLEDLKAVGAAYRRVMGRHFPAMALIEITALVEDGARVEIQAQAVVG